MPAFEEYTTEQAAEDIGGLIGQVDALNEFQQIGSLVISSTGGPLGTGDVTGPDTWHDTGAMASGWSKTGYFKYTMLANGIVYVAATLTPDGTATNKPDGSTILVAANGLPAAYAPVSNKLLPAWCNALRTGAVGTATEAAALSFITDGSVQCYGVAAAATSLILHGCFPVAI